MVISNEHINRLRDDKATCPYCQVFATPPLPAHSLQKFSAMPQPYVIEPPEGGAQRLQAGQTFTFGLVLIGDLAPFADLLHLGQWLHVGKNATFGLGGYRCSTMIT